MLLVARLFIVFLTINLVCSHRILMYFPTPSISHQVVFQPIWKALSLRGHEVTVITPNPLKNDNLKNLTEIDMGFLYPEIPKLINIQEISASKDLINHVRIVDRITHAFEEANLKSPQVQAFLKDDTQQFDLVVIETFFSVVGHALGVKYNAPVVGIASFSGLLHVHDAVGNPTHPAITADCLLDLGGDFTFMERVENVLFNIWYRIYHKYVGVPTSDALARKYISPNIPYLGDVQDLKLLFLNTNPILNYVRPNVPSVIEIGQMHIKPKQPLPKEIKDYLDKSRRGVIYFSLGSNVKSSNSSEAFVNTVKAALAELPYDVMWKWETDFMPDKPDNVFIKKWFPQQDVLGHPNVKLFITQGGLQSMEEAITNGVPLVVIPFVGDQYYNARRMVHMKIAKRLSYGTMTKQELKQAIVDVIENKMYKQKTLKYKSLLLDQPMTGLEKAIWWIEYLLRHNGDIELNSSATKIPFYQYFLIDVLLFFIAVIVSVVLILSLTVKYTLSYILKSTGKLKTN